MLDAAVEQATVEVPNALIDARARELLERMLHNLEHQGIQRDMYFQISGKTEEELLEEARPDAERTLRREAVLAAIVEAEGIEPSDGDVLDALQASAAREDTTPEKLRDRLEKAGRLDDLREDLRQRAALDLIVEHATAVEAAPRGRRRRRGRRRVDRSSSVCAPTRGDPAGNGVWRGLPVASLAPSVRQPACSRKESRPRTETERGP